MNVKGVLIALPIVGMCALAWFFIARQHSQKENTNMNTNTGSSPTPNQWKFSSRSKNNLSGVKSDLQKVAYRALSLSQFDLGITSGMRTAEEQNALFKQGASQLDGYSKISKHQTGDAIDFVVYDENGKVTWGWSYYLQVSWAFKQAANELGIKITWGGDWLTFKDGAHIQLG